MANHLEPRARRVKVLATLGPASNTETMIAALLAAGADAFRVNMSHGDHATHAATIAAMTAWRAQRSGLHLTLVRGNHDKHAGDPPSSLRIEVVDEPWQIGSLLFAHHPQSHPKGYVLAGHVHPVYRLASRGDALRLPCFVFGADSGMLPSFGSFTGGHPVVPEAGDRLFVTTDDSVMEVTSAAKSRSGNRRR